MSSVSGLKGYNVYLDDVKKNTVPVTDLAQFQLTGLASGTDFASRIKVSAVDNAGNETTPVTLASLSVTAATAAPAPENTELSLEKRNAIDAWVAQHMKPTLVSDGVIIGVSTPDGDYYKAYGGDRTADSPLTLDDKMRWGSISKMAVNTLILKEIDAGHISFDDTVDMYVEGPEFWSTVTIKHLLMMTSGIKDYLQQDPAVGQAYFLSPTATLDAMTYIRSYPPLYEAGTSSSYSNSNTILMGLILEWCDAEYGSSRDIRTIVLEDCVQAMELDEAEWPTGNFMTEPYARGWTPNLALPTIQAMLGPFTFLAGLFGYPTAAELEFTAVHPSWGGAAGDLDGPIADLVKFGEGLHAGTLLTSEMKQLREEVFTTYLTYTPAGPWEGSGWIGFGLGVVQWGSWLGWIGSLAGYNSTVFFNIDNGAVIAIMMNNLSAVALALHYRIAYELYPESALAHEQQVRIDEIPASSASVNAPYILIDHAPGDEDSTTTVPLKVPFYI